MQVKRQVSSMNLDVVGPRRECWVYNLNARRAPYYVMHVHVNRIDFQRNNTIFTKANKWIWFPFLMNFVCLCINMFYSQHFNIFERVLSSHKCLNTFIIMRFIWEVGLFVCTLSLLKTKLAKLLRWNIAKLLRWNIAKLLDWNIAKFY